MVRNRLNRYGGNKSFFDLTQDKFKMWEITENTPEKGDGEQETHIF